MVSIDISKFIDGYIDNSPNQTIIHYWDLPNGIRVKLTNPPKELTVRGETFTIGKIKRVFGNSAEIEDKIISIVNWRNHKHEFSVKFPIHLTNEKYVLLYSLMLSEGSSHDEFRIHVPEEEFHAIFQDNLNSFFEHISINQSIAKNIKVSKAPECIRHLIPIPRYIPRFILEEKEFARIYLRVAFEAEGHFRYKHLKNEAVNRRIKLSRNTGIDSLIAQPLSYNIGERIPFSQIEKDNTNLAKSILNNPCPIILGEAILLKKHFDIDVSLFPEYIRINKTSFRRGKTSVKWTMYLHSINIDRFVNDIGAITERKKQLCELMGKVTLRRPNYNALKIMKQSAKNGIFSSREYSSEMLKVGYKFPEVFLSKYKKKNLIRKVDSQHYLLL